MNKKRGLLLGAMLLLAQMSMNAQTPGQQAVGQAATEISGYAPMVSNLILAIGGIVGLVGAIRAYIKWNNGDQDVQKTLVSWFGACIFLVAAGTIITAFFA